MNRLSKQKYDDAPHSAFLISMCKMSVAALLSNFKARVTEIDEVKKQSVASKKALAEMTRAFMKQEHADAMKSFSELLRAYQMEVESLSKRCRSSETAFIEMTNLLSNMPSTQSVSGSAGEDEVMSLRSEIADLVAELSQMKNQDLTVRQQASRIKELEAQKVSNLNVMEADYAKKRDEIELNYSSRFQQLQADFEQVNSRTKSLESEIAQLNQLRFEEKNKADQLLLSKQDEVNQLMQQVESLEVRVSVGNVSNSGTLDQYKDMLAQNEGRINSLEQALFHAREEAAVKQERLKREVEEGFTENKKLKIERESLLELIESVREEVEKSFGLRIESSSTLAEVLRGADLRHAKEINELNIRVSDLITARNQLVQEAQSKDEKIDELNRLKIRDQEPLAQAQAGSEEVVTIMQAQRDRFRTRVLELEAERDSLKTGQLDLTNKLHAVSAEKKKVESERNFWKAQNAETKPKSPGDIELGTSTPPVLTATKRRVITSSNQAGSVREIEHSVTSLLVWGLGNPLTRRAGLVYLLTLHLLVFLVLYRISSIVSNSR